MLSFSLDLSRHSNEIYEYFLNEHLIPDNKQGALLFAFLVTFLLSIPKLYIYFSLISLTFIQDTEVQHEQIFLLNALKEGAKLFPEAFTVV
jgi:hypothetical protein